MNLMLFDKAFESVRLEGGDPRAQHSRKVLRAEVGALVFLGFVNGPRAETACVAAVSATATKLGLWTEQTATEL